MSEKAHKPSETAKRLIGEAAPVPETPTKCPTCGGPCTDTGRQWVCTPEDDDEENPTLIQFDCPKCQSFFLA